VADDDDPGLCSGDGFVELLDEDVASLDLPQIEEAVKAKDGQVCGERCRPVFVVSGVRDEHVKGFDILGFGLCCHSPLNQSVNRVSTPC